MKIPEPTPSFNPDDMKRLLNVDGPLLKPSPALSQLLQKANQKYLYWEDFKYLPMPEGLSAQDAWRVLSLRRRANRQTILLCDSQKRSFDYFITPSMQSQLSQIDQSAGVIFKSEDSWAEKIRHDDRFILKSLMEEGIASSLIEGAATTRVEAKKMLQEDRKPSSHGEQMVLNNYLTIKKIRDEWKDEKLSPGLILQIHKSMTKNTLKNEKASGAFRKSDADNDFGVYWSDQTLLFKPMPASEINTALEAMCEFANLEQTDEDFVHPFIKAILLHFWFAYIHPFEDGNGRTARAIFYWYLLSQKYWLFEFLPISRVIQDQYQQYLKAFLYVEHDQNDLNYFLHNQLSAIVRAIDDFKKYLIEKRKEEMAAMRLFSEDPTLNERQRNLLVHARTNPGFVYTIKGHQNACRVVHQTARTDLLSLVKAGYLDVQASGKKLVFIARDKNDPK